MKPTIENKTGKEMKELMEMAHRLYPYSQKRLGFNKPAHIEFHSDPRNASKMLGKTAYYNPAQFKVVVYTDGRHPKDILRSLSHELVHHAQNCRGEFDKGMEVGEGYAQKDKHLREMEKEAYLEGNMIFRDLEDSIKETKTMNEETIREVVTKLLEKLTIEGKVPPQLAPFVKKAQEKAKDKKDDDKSDEKDEKDEKKDSDAKPDFLDLDKDGNKDEPMSDAAEDAQNEVMGFEGDEETEVTKKDINPKNESAERRHQNRLNEALMNKWCK